MILEIFIAILLGCLVGTFSGLTPGVHINLISLIVLSSSALLLEITSPLVIAVFIISMAIVHTFLDAIPSIYLGAPEEETILSVLPGHRLLLQGKGYEAVMLTLIGAFSALVLTILFLPLISIIIKFIYPYLERVMAYVLISVSIFLVFKEKKSRMWALIIFLLSGVLGIVVLNLPNLKDPLFPLLSGLFGISTLIISLSEKVKIPKQIISFPKVSKKDLSKIMGSTLTAGSLCSFLPGLGPSQAAIIGSSFYKKISSENFLVLVGGLGTMNMLLSIISLYLIGKARNGAIVIMGEIFGEVLLKDVILFVGVSLVSACIGVFLTIKITKIFSRIMTKVNYQKLIMFIIILVTSMVFFLSSHFLGLLVLVVSTLLGILPAKLGIGRNHLMGCLIVPVILYFLL